jgi:hypothetical protein
MKAQTVPDTRGLKRGMTTNDLLIPDGLLLDVPFRGGDKP